MAQSHNGQRSNASDSAQNQQLDKSLPLDPDGFNVVQDPQEDDVLDIEEVSKLSVFPRLSWKMRDSACSNLQPQHVQFLKETL